MKRTSALRRKASYIFGVIGLAAGGLAGVAVADGLPPVVTTSIVPTVSVAVSTPVVTATVTTPSVTVPVPTTATVTAPTVTTPVVPTPTVTAPLPVTTTAAVTAKVTTPATPAVPTPVGKVSLPTAAAVTAKATVAVTPHPDVAASASTSGPGAVHASAGGAVHSATGSARAAVSTAAAPSAALSHGGTALLSQRAAPLSSTDGGVSAGGALLRGEGVSGAVAPAPAGSAALPLPFAGPTGDPAAAASVSRPGPGLEAFSFVPSLVPADRPAVATDGEFGPAVVPLPTPTIEQGLTRHKAALAGGLTALVALAALGLAGAARGSTTLAACAELARFPFPRFRVLRCPRVGAPTFADHTAVPGAGARPGVPTGSAAAGGPRRADTKPTLPVLPRIGILGTAFSKSQPWELLKAVVLAMLAAANALLLAVRWRLGRAQGR